MPKDDLTVCEKAEVRSPVRRLMLVIIVDKEIFLVGRLHE